MYTQILSEQDELKERLAKMANDALNWAFNNPVWTIVIIILAIALLVFLVVKGVIKAIGPIDLNPDSVKRNKHGRCKADRLITDLPAPMPSDKNAQLPPKLRRVLRQMKEGTRKRIAIVCNDHSQAEELGKLLYHRINEKKIGNHIGWLTYKKLEKRPLTISTCINAEFSIYRDEKDYELRSSLCKKFLRSSKYHTILFVNMIDFPEQKDTELEQCNNLPGLSIILLTSVEISGFDKIYFEQIGGGDLKVFKGLIKSIASHMCAFQKTVHYLTSIPEPVDMNRAIALGQENALYRQLKNKGCHLLLYGDGGSGKTHMARKLFYRIRKHYERLAWVEYGTDMRTTLLSSFPEFDYETDPEIRFVKIIKKLSEEPKKTILFIDDVKEDANQDDVLTRLTGLGITIFITSRCEKIVPYISYEIQPLNTNECAELFYMHYRADRKRKHIKVVRKLVDALNCNPMLAILIGRVIGNDRNLLIFAQRVMIDSRSPQVLSAKTLYEHIGKLIKVSNWATEENRIMQSLALLPSGETPADVCSWFNIDISKIESLVAKGWLDKKTTSGAYILHDLIREYFRQNTIPERVVTRFLQYVTTQPFFSTEDTSEDIQYKLDSIEEAINLTSFSCPYYGDALICLGDIYYELNRYAVALSRYEQALKSIEDKANPDCNRILDVFWGMGMVYNDLGIYDKALENYQNAEEAIIKMGGSDRAIMAGLNNNIGIVYLMLADYSKALDYLQKALKDQEQFLGDNHQDTANSYGNIGNTYYRMGEFKTAREYYQKSLKIQIELFGDMHPDVASTYNNIGNTYIEMADFNTAQYYYQKALMIREEVLGVFHLDTASSYHNIGNVHSDMGEYVEAHQFYKKAVNIVKTVLGPNHPVTAQVYVSVGVTHFEQGEYEKALEYYKKALQIQEDVLGSEHPDTANSYNNIGEVYYKIKDLVKAKEYHEKALKIRKNTEKPNLQDCAESYDNLGATYCAIGDWSKAKECCEKALTIQQDKLPEHHPEIAKTLVHLGDCCSASNDNDIAMEYYIRALKIYLAVLGNSHPHTMGTQVLIKEKMLSIYPDVNFDSWIHKRLND